MAESTTNKLSRVEQCRKNAKEKSEAKHRAFLEALALQVREGESLAKATVCKRAGVTTPFLRQHPDLLQALEDAQKARLVGAGTPPATSSLDRGKDKVIEELAANTPLADGEMRRLLQDALLREQKAEARAENLQAHLFTRRAVKTNCAPRGAFEYGHLAAAAPAGR